MHWRAGGDPEEKPNAVIDEGVVLDPTIRAPMRREILGNPSPMQREGNLGFWWSTEILSSASILPWGTDLEC